MKKLNQIVIPLFIIFCFAIISCNFGNSAQNPFFYKLAKDSIIDNVFIPANSQVEQQGVVKLIYPSKAVEVQGYLIRERKHTNDHFSIDENGNLLFFAPQNDIEIDGIPCRGQKDVQLFQDGELMRCYLSKSFEINGVIYKNDSHLLFDEQGNVEIFNMSLFNKIRERNQYPMNH